MRVYLDDVRPTPEGFTHRAETAAEAIAFLETGNVTFISFDHDLGEPANGTGHDVALWIEAQTYSDNTWPFPDYVIHSANPVGAHNIARTMRQARAIRERGKYVGD